MMFRNLFILLLVLAAACKTTAVKQPLKPIALKPAPSTNPMSCGIEGKVLAIIKAFDADSLSICSKFPCRARVRITSVTECGSAVTQPLTPGDTVELKFMYSLGDTKKAFPYMKAHYPGLKEGQTFSATAEQRLVPGTGGIFIVFGYEAE